MGADTATGSGQRRRYLPAAVTVLALPVAGLLLTVWLLPSLPGRVASHWGLDGRPDGYSSPLEGAFLALGFAIVGVLVVVLALPRIPDPVGRRVLGGICAGVPAAVAALGLLTLVGQSSRFTTTPATAPPMPWWVLPVSLLVAVVLGVGAVRALPRPVIPVAEVGPPADAPRVPGGPRAGLRWEGRCGAPAVLPVLAIPTSLVLVIGLVAVVQGDGFSLLVGLLGFVALLDLLVGGMLFVRVAVDAQGLQVSSALPVLRSVRLARMRIPLSTIVQAWAVDVNPLRQFGGWGYRIGTGGRAGFVLRTGEALEVLRSNGSRFVVTVDGAREGAAVLNTLLDGDRDRTRP